VNRYRSSGSAHRGLGEWLWQRLTALYLGGFTVFVVLRLGFAPFADYAAWRAWMLSPTMRIAVALAFAAALLHAWIGMRSVYLDYLPPLGLRVLVSAVTAVALLVVAAWVGEVLLWGAVP
jgi:succinate dehydrogenase / fumarate reductase membrane anchor subunit